TFTSSGLPDSDDLDIDTFDRQRMVPGHRQEALEKAGIVLVGAGGLNSWVALGLVRSGVRRLTVIDPDRVEKTNLRRQLYFAQDIGKAKARCLAENLTPHMTVDGTITAMAVPFQEAIAERTLNCDLLIVGVDNIPCRLAAVQFARNSWIPAVFAMLSKDGTRC